MAGAIAGLIVGSYVATLVLRWPAGAQTTSGRSSCDRCGTILRAADLIPLVSYALRRGRCRACSARIDPLHWQVEFAAAAIACAALLVSPTPAGAALALFGWLLLPLAALDWRHLWLPDRLTGLLALIGLGLGGLVSHAGLTDRLIGGGAGFASLWLLALAYRKARGRDGLGQGDSKLLGAIGLWSGWIALPSILVIAAGLGLVLAVAKRKSASDEMPFGTLLAVGGWIVVAMMLARA